MADFLGTAALVDWKNAFSGHPGHLIATITLTAGTYGAGNLNLSSIIGNVPASISARPDKIKAVHFHVGGTPAYMVNWTKATTPTWSNLGTLGLFTATGTAATGTLTFVVQVTVILGDSNPF